MPEGLDILVVVLYSVFALLVLIGNTIVIIVIIKSRQLHLPTLWNITVMAAWDLALGLHWLVFVVPSKIFDGFVYPDRVGLVASQLLLFICIQNMLNIVVALVDRYISICWPLRYHTLMSAKRFAFAVITVFVLNLFQKCVLFFTNDGIYDVVYNKALGIYKPLKTHLRMILSGGFVVAGSLIIVTLLIRIHLELGRKRSKGYAGGQRNNSAQFTYTMYISTIVFIVCYLPAAIGVLVSFITQKELNDVLLQVAVTCILSNSLWNIFIYAITYRPFKDAFLKLFFPACFRERKRREFQIQFKRDRISVFTIE